MSTSTTMMVPTTQRSPASERPTPLTRTSHRTCTVLRGGNAAAFRLWRARQTLARASAADLRGRVGRGLYRRASGRGCWDCDEPPEKCFTWPSRQNGVEGERRAMELKMNHIRTVACATNALLALFAGVATSAPNRTYAKRSGHSIRRARLLLRRQHDRRSDPARLPGACLSPGQAVRSAQRHIGEESAARSSSHAPPRRTR